MSDQDSMENHCSLVGHDFLLYSDGSRGCRRCGFHIAAPTPVPGMTASASRPSVLPDIRGQVDRDKELLARAYDLAKERARRRRALVQRAVTWLPWIAAAALAVFAIVCAIVGR